MIYFLNYFENLGVFVSRNNCGSGLKDWLSR